MKRYPLPRRYDITDGAYWQQIDQLVVVLEDNHGFRRNI